MKSGEVLIKKLGLENIPNAVICRLLMSTYRIYYVFYDSRRLNFPITPTRVKTSRRVASVYSGSQFSSLNSEKPLRHTPFAPLIDLKEFNGNLGGDSIFIAVDIAGDTLIRDKNFSNEIRENVSEEILHEKYVKVLFGEKLEELTIYDFKSSNGMSDFTKGYARKRGSIMGSENVTAELQDVILNEKENYVDVIFIDKATEGYEDGHRYKEVNPYMNFKIEKNPFGYYRITWRFEKFFDWLDAQDIDSIEKITPKHVKEIFEIADFKYFSNDVSFHYQGCNFYSSQLGTSIYPTSIPPTAWDKYKSKIDGSTHSGNQLMSKHLNRLVNQSSFWLNPIASMLTKRLRDEGYIK